MSKLCVIEGSDGSGKTVQSALLHSYLQDNGVNSKILNFPDYESDTGKLVKSMLSGTFGKDPVSLNPYFTSSMYSIDRKQLWERIKSEKWFDDVDVFICNRYMLSNLIHQGARINDPNDLDKFYRWLKDFEYNKLELPVPSLVIYLYLPYKICLENVQRRSKEENRMIDINESAEYLKKVNNNIDRLIREEMVSDWTFVNCANEYGDGMRTVMDINSEVIDIVKREIIYK